MKNERFELIYKQSNTLGSHSFEIWVDRETGVQYAYRQNGYSGGLTPLLDRDGKPLISSMSSWE